MKIPLPLRSTGRFFISLLIVGTLASLAVMACSLHNAPDPEPDSPAEMPSISLTKIAGGFAKPIHIADAGDGGNRLFIVEQGGLVRIIREGAVLTTPFLDLSSLLKSSAGEQGLLSLAFPPGYAPSGKRHFYVYYTANQGIGDTVLARYSTSADAEVADPASGQPLLTIVQPFANHNGGQLAFGPDGFLYLGIGDGGSGGDPFGNGQKLDTLLGKILRIDVESQPGAYTIPVDNPFSGLTGRRPEIWAFGLRNPWRFSFDRGTGDLYIADVGQNEFEEVDVQPAASKGGENYGWNIMEGAHCFSNPNCDQAGLTLPVAEYDHGLLGDCSISGGFVYRGSEFPALRGIYLYGDFCSGKIWGLRRAGEAWENKLLLDTDLSIPAFGEDEAGNLYVADYNAGDIYKIIVPAAGQ